MKKNRWYAIFGSLMIMAAFSGCELLREAYEAEMEYASEDPTSEDYKPCFVVGVFSVVNYPRATMLERKISGPDGEEIWINTNQLFDSKRIRDARAMPRPGDPDLCDLRFKLDDAGKSHWQMLVAASQGEPVVVMVDSRYVGTFVPEVPRDNGRMNWVNMRVGVDSYTARGIVKFAKKNYAHFNPKVADWFNF